MKNRFRHPEREKERFSTEKDEVEPFRHLNIILRTSVQGPWGYYAYMGNEK